MLKGLHPKNGRELPKDSVVNEIDVNRAMATAVLALAQMSARLVRRAQLPESVGKTWTEEEKGRLRGEFSGGEAIPLVATRYGRTIRAIEARLEKLGLLTADQRMTANPFFTTIDPKDNK